MQEMSLTSAGLPENSLECLKAALAGLDVAAEAG